MFRSGTNPPVRNEIEVLLDDIILLQDEGKEEPAEANQAAREKQEADRVLMNAAEGVKRKGD